MNKFKWKDGQIDCLSVYLPVFLSIFLYICQYVSVHLSPCIFTYFPVFFLAVGVQSHWHLPQIFSVSWYLSIISLSSVSLRLFTHSHVLISTCVSTALNLSICKCLSTCPPVISLSLLPVNLFICSPVNLSIHIPIHLPICYPSTCPFVYLYTCIPEPGYTSTCFHCLLAHLYTCPCLPVHLSFCIPAPLYACPPVYLSLCLLSHLYTCPPLPVHLYTFPFVYLSLYLQCSLYICPLSTCSPVHLSICVHVHLFTCFSVCMSTWPQKTNLTRGQVVWQEDIWEIRHMDRKKCIGRQVGRLTNKCEQVEPWADNICRICLADRWTSKQVNSLTKLQVAWLCLSLFVL